MLRMIFNIVVTKNILVILSYVFCYKFFVFNEY